MIKTGLSIVFLITIMMTAAIAASIEIIPEAEATKSAGKNAPGRVGVKSYGSANAGIVCGDRLCSEVAPPKEVAPEEPPAEEAPPEEEMEETMEPEMEETVEPEMEVTMEPKVPAKWQTVTGTLNSMIDPGIGHDTQKSVQI